MAPKASTSNKRSSSRLDSSQKKKGKLDSTQNPSVTHEVMSDSSDNSDRGRDFSPIESFILVPSLLEKWNSDYSTRPLCYSFLIDPFLQEQNIPCFVKFKNYFCGWFNKNRVAVYPKLVRLFYLNLSVNVHNGSKVIFSTIKNRSIAFDVTLLRTILQLPEVNNKNHPPQSDLVDKAYRTLVLPTFDPKSGKQLTHTSLRFEAKLLHNLLTRLVFPKLTSTQQVPSYILPLIQLILDGFEIDYAELLFTYMIDCALSKRKTPLPYANILTEIFNHFDIPVSVWDTPDNSYKEINRDSLGDIGIYLLPSGAWKTWEEFEEGDEAEAAKIYKIKNVSGRSSKATAGASSSASSGDMATIIDLLHDIKAKQDDQSLQISMLWNALHSHQYQSSQHFHTLQNQIASTHYQTSLNHAVLKALVPILPSDRDAASTNTAMCMRGCLEDAVYRFPVRSFDETYFAVRTAVASSSAPSEEEFEDKLRSSKARIQEIAEDRNIQQQIEAEERLERESKRNQDRADIETEIKNRVEAELANARAQAAAKEKVDAKGRADSRGKTKFRGSRF